MENSAPSLKFFALKNCGNKNRREFTKTIIPFALVGYEVIITNSRYALVGYFITSYPTRAHGIIVIYSACHSVYPRKKTRLARYSTVYPSKPLDNYYIYKPHLVRFSFQFCSVSAKFWILVLSCTWSCTETEESQARSISHLLTELHLSLASSIECRSISRISERYCYNPPVFPSQCWLLYPLTVMITAHKQHWIERLE